MGINLLLSDIKNKTSEKDKPEHCESLRLLFLLVATNLSSWRFDCIILPLFLVDADGQATPFRMLLLGELPTVADVGWSIELRHDLDTADSGVFDLQI